MAKTECILAPRGCILQARGGLQKNINPVQSGDYLFSVKTFLGRSVQGIAKTKYPRFIVKIITCSSQDLVYNTQFYIT